MINTQLRPVRILLAGMNTPENQLTRGLSRYTNVKVVWHVPDPGKSFPLDCDAAVIPIAHCSHDTMWTVKDAYKKLGRRVFLIRESFSELKGPFEQWIDKNGHDCVEQQKTTLLGQELFKALKEIKPEEPSQTEEKPVHKKRFSPRGNWTNNYIHRGYYKDHLPYQQIADALNGEGITTLIGTRWTAANTATAVSNMRLSKFKNDYTVLERAWPGQKAQAKVTTASPVQQPSAPTTLRKQTDAHALIQLVVDSEITKDVKMKLLEALL